MLHLYYFQLLSKNQFTTTKKFRKKLINATFSSVLRNQQLMNSQSKINLNSLNIVRSIAIILVVLRHSFSPYLNAWEISKYYNTNRVVQIIGEYISTFSMPLFVFISGFIYAYLRLYKKKYSTYKILITKKIRRLLIPYFFFGIIYIAVFMKYDSFISFVEPLWFGCGHLWFILMMFLIFILFYPLETYFKNNIKSGIIISVFCFLISSIFNYYKLDPLFDVTFYLLFFYLGYLFCYKYEKVNNLLKNRSFLFLGIHAILFATKTFFLKDIDNRILNVLQYQIFMIPLGVTAICFSFTYFRTIRLNSTCHNIISLINKNSYYIYLFHQPILMVLFGLNLFQTFPIIVVIMLGFLITFSASLFISEIAMKKYIPRILIGAN